MNPSLSPTPVHSSSRTLRFHRYFVTGLLALAPLWLTGYVVVLVVRTLGGFLSPHLRALAVRVLGEGHWPALAAVASDIAGFVITVLLVVLAGWTVSKVFGQRAVELVGSLLGRIPVIREFYTGVRKFGELLLGDKTGPKRVVAVQFPHERAWRLGFVTNEYPWKFPEGNGSTFIAVFVPGTPNPTSGFLVFYSPQDVVPLSMSVDEAIKLIVSGGTLSADRLAESDSATG